MARPQTFNDAAKPRPPQAVVNRLFTATQHGQLDEIKATLSQNPDALECKLHGKTALQVAVEKGQLRALQALLEAGANPNAPSDDGQSSPFIAAVAADNMLMVINLLHKGAKVNPQDGLARKPLHAAVQSESVKSIPLLVRHGASLKAFDDEGDTPLHAALGAKKMKAVKALLESGADIDARNRDGHTPLMQAAEQNNITAAKFLIEQGAALDPLSDLRENAQDIARAFPGKDGKFLRAFEQAISERLQRETKEYLPEFRKGTAQRITVKKPAKFRPK